MNNKIDMTKAMVDHFEREYCFTKSVLTLPKHIIGKPSDVVWYSVQRCMGVAEFCKNNDLVPADIAESVYEGIRERLENLSINPLTND
jgi:hypothetical protein